MMSDPSLLSLEGTLERSFPGLTVLDHDLELSERHSADLVAMEAGGRLVLVLLVDAGGDTPVLAALDALAFARHNASVLAAHFEEPRLAGGEPPRVLLVAQTFPPGTAERLLPLTGSAVELYEVRQVRSARGENVYLTPVGSGPVAGIAPATATGTRESFLASLPTDLEVFANDCLERLERIDEELVLTARPGRAAIGFRGQDLARLELAGGRLVGAVGAGSDARALRSRAHVDLFVEEVLGRYVSRLGLSPGLDEGVQAPGPVDPLPGADEPLLSADEIRAFQE